MSANRIDGMNKEQIIKVLFIFTIILTIVGCATSKRLMKNCSVLGGNSDGVMVYECDPYTG